MRHPLDTPHHVVGAKRTDVDAEFLRFGKELRIAVCGEERGAQRLGRGLPARRAALRTGAPW